eukprot:CFRG8387T1
MGQTLRDADESASVGAWNESVFVATNFLPTACHTCKQYNVRLQRCSGCKIYSYCSEEHQAAHWPEHKTFCKGIAFLQKHKLVPLADISDVPTSTESYSDTETGLSVPRSAPLPVRTHEEWCELRLRLSGALQSYLQRPLLLHEHQACMFMNHCENCRRTYTHKGDTDTAPAETRALTRCEKCEAVSYCSLDCKENSQSHHDSWCAEHCLYMELERVVSEKGLPPPWIPNVLHEKKNGSFILPETFEEYLQMRDFPAGIFTPSLLTLSHVFSSQALTYPLTILSALQMLANKNSTSNAETASVGYIPYKKDLVIHLVGANAQSECLHAVKYEELMHVLPTVESLTVVFIGPHAPEWEDTDNERSDMCESCITRGKSFRLRYRRMQYNTFVTNAGTAENENEKDILSADVIVAYNCGFHEYKNSDSDTWSKAMPYMLKKGVPLVATSYTLSESAADSAYVKSHGGTVAIPTYKNPFFGRKPFRDWKRDDECDFYYYNNYTTVFEGSMNHS